MVKSNDVLRQITAQIYQRRPTMSNDLRTNYRIERVNGGLLCDLWFLTSGCIHDRQGGCTMCNYGKAGKHIEQQRILSELGHIVKELPLEFEDFLLTPSGSMLDQREVPTEMCESLIHLLKNVKTQRFIIETRVDTITPASLDFMHRFLPDSKKYIEIGVETSNDWILKHCVNKNATYRMFQQAVKTIHREKMYVTANIGLGFPFISERASIYDAVRSIKTVLADGSDSVVVFPYHIKSGTLLEVMHRHSMYQCVSLWALVEVLSSFSADELQNIQISWYKDYFGEVHSHICHSPGTCPQCKNDVLRLLDEYRNRQDPEIIVQLKNYPCQCHDKWREQLESQAKDVELQLVEKYYRKLAELFHISKETLEQELIMMRDEFARNLI